ncbi:uncharacterized [Tachysurus ichikawai]
MSLKTTDEYNTETCLYKGMIKPLKMENYRIITMAENERVERHLSEVACETDTKARVHRNSPHQTLLTLQSHISSAPSEFLHYEKSSVLRMVKLTCFSSTLDLNATLYFWQFMNLRLDSIWRSFVRNRFVRFVLKYQTTWLLWVTCFIMMTSAWLSNLGLIPECKLKGVILLSSPDAVLLRANLSRGTAACDLNRALTALFVSATKQAFAKDNKDTWWLFYLEFQ